MNIQLKEDGENIIRIVDKKTLSQVADYWTEERKKNAIPVEELPFFKALSLENNDDDINGGIPEHPDITKSPYNAGGKLFMTFGNADAKGSAEFCADKQLILTAAHCIYDTDRGVWAKNMLFERAYDNGKSQQSVAIQSQAIKAKWSETGGVSYDYGFLVASKPCDVEPLKYKIGVVTGRATSFGYPSNYDDGKRMNCVTGEIKKIQYTSEEVALCMDNTMYSGASGGAYVEEGTVNVISVNSRGNKTTLKGPVLDEKFINLIEYAKKFL